MSFEITSRWVLLTTLALALTACGGGSSSSPDAEPRTGFVSIGITDAPVDEVSAVVVEFTGVTLKPEGGDEIVIVYDTPRSFDLLMLTGGVTAELLESTEAPAGVYNWVRLAVNAEFDTIFDSYAMTPTGQVELRVPSGSNNGLKLVSGFTVTQDQMTSLVIDWDLRQALSDPQGQPGFHLRPALRITDLSQYGTLTGTVAPELIADPSCENGDAMDTGNSVYIYNGVVETPGDIGDALTPPFTTANVAQNVDGIYGFEVNFLSIGEYSAAFTCQASIDDPEVDDDIAFSVPQSFMIDDGVTTPIAFDPPPPPP